MSAHQEIKDLSHRVKELLEEDERYRIYDRKLCARVWAEELGGVDKLKTMTAYDFLLEYVAPDKLSSQDSITRLKRMVQQKFPELAPVGKDEMYRAKEVPLVQEALKEIEGGKEKL